MTSKTAAVPRSLRDGLVMRWATADDIESLAQFNFRMHSDNPDGVPDVWLKAWTRELMNGSHCRESHCFGGCADFSTLAL
jgi:hypothetical protein